MDALQKDWTFTRQLTVDLLDACSQGDLDFALNSHCGPLWKQFRIWVAYTKIICQR